MLIEGLQNPDGDLRKASAAELIAMGEEATMTIYANLSFCEPKVQTRIMKVLQAIADPSICLELMRFVFDKRKNGEATDACVVAIKTIATIGPEEGRAKILRFGLGLMKDEDRFIKAGAIAILGKFGDKRVVGILEEQLKEEAFLSELASVALTKVRDLDADQDSKFDDERILQEIRNAQGGQRDFFIAELKRRDNAFELANTLVKSKGRGAIVGLHVMQELDDSRIRKVAFELLIATKNDQDNSATMAIALRLLSSHLQGDGSAQECDLIRSYMVNPDIFVRVAAILAASTTGNENLVGHAIRQFGSIDSPETTKHIAKGISETLPEYSRWIIPHTIVAIDQVLSKKEDPNNQNKLTLAYLIRVLRHATKENSLGSTDAEGAVFRALAGANGFPQIVIASLELLEKTAPDDGHKFSQRWSQDQTLIIARLLSVVPENLTSKILRLLYLGAAPGVLPLADLLRPMAFGNAEEVSLYVIPLLAETHSPIADDIIAQLASDSDEAIKNAAIAAQRRNRNAKEWIDAQFE